MKKKLDAELTAKMVEALTGFDKILSAWKTAGWKKKWNLLNIGATETAVAVENIFKANLGMANAEKIDYAAELLDRLVPLPFWAEPFDKPIFKYLINKAVAWLNKKYGHVQWTSEPTVAAEMLKAEMVRGES